MPTNVVKRMNRAVGRTNDDDRRTQRIENEVVAVIWNLRDMTRYQPLRAQETFDFHLEDVSICVERLSQGPTRAMLAHQSLQLGRRMHINYPRIEIYRRSGGGR